MTSSDSFAANQGNNVCVCREFTEFRSMGVKTLLLMYNLYTDHTNRIGVLSGECYSITYLEVGLYKLQTCKTNDFFLFEKEHRTTM